LDRLHQQKQSRDNDSSPQKTKHSAATPIFSNGVFEGADDILNFAHSALPSDSSLALPTTCSTALLTCVADPVLVDNLFLQDNSN